MTLKPLSIALLSACLLTVAPHAKAQQAPMELSLLRGGAVQADPVAHGDLVYLPTGRTIATWAYDDPAAPLHLSDSAPASGIINGLVRHGEYLYASWRGRDGTIGGLTTWSLADPIHPERVHEIDGYIDADMYTQGLVIANDHLYLFDQNHGVFVADLADPAAPELMPTGTTPTAVAYTRLAAHGDIIHATGRSSNYLSTVLHLYDASQPLSPSILAQHHTDGIDHFSLLLGHDHAIGVGNRLTLFDLAEPLAMEPRGWIETPPSISGARVGAHVYTFGYGPGLDIWNISDIDAPEAGGHLDIRSFGGNRILAMGDRLLLQTDTDLMLALDVSTPAAPEPVSTAWLPGGTATLDFAEHGDSLVLLQQNYGLTLADPDTLQPMTRFDADLPEIHEDRDFTRVVMDGDIAHMTAWGYGLISVDLSDPAEPVEIGRMPFPFAMPLAVDGHHAYLASVTNDLRFGVADLSDPSAPTLVWLADMPAAPQQIRIHDGHAYLAELGGQHDADTGGLRIFSLADPASPVQVGHLNDGCGFSYDIAIDANVSLAYVACSNGLQVIDIAEPAAPVVVSHHELWDQGSRYPIAQRGDRAWLGRIEGLHEFDISDPTAPVLLDIHPIGRNTPRRVGFMGDDRLLVLGNESGIHIFAPGDNDGDDAIPLENGVPATGLEGDQGDDLLFSIEVPEGATALTVLSYGGSGNADLLVRHGQPPTAEEHDAGSSRPGNNETVRIADPAAGTWYIRLTGTQAFGGVSLQARH